MTSTDRPSLVQIIHGYTDGRMSARPEYYSGRGVNRGDMNGQHIKMIYDGVKAELGDAAAAALVQMVEAISDMSATGFLNSLFRLERYDWKFDAKAFNKPNDGVAFNDEVTAFCTVASMFGRRSSPEFESFEGESIKAEFYGLIGHSPKATKRKAFSYGF